MIGKNLDVAAGTVAPIWTADERRVFADPDYAAAVRDVVAAAGPFVSTVGVSVLEDTEGRRVAVGRMLLPAGEPFIVALDSDKELPQ